jgi:two-component system response regulator HydG
MTVLVADDDEILRLSVRWILEAEGYQVLEVSDGEEAIQRVAADPTAIDAVILDVNMPKMDGMEALTHLRQAYPKIPCLLLTAFSNVKDAVQAMKLGAFDYLEKPIEGPRLISLIQSALAANELVETAAFSAPQVEFEPGRKMVGSSSKIREVFDIINKLAKVETSVMIRGESGTGKELVARAIHFNSCRKNAPFVPINCGAMPENLIESELFGYERGAFTGAERKKIGKFQFADGGTVFLDEIGDVTPSLQVKLLRVLQEQSFYPIGSHEEVRVNVRVIAATHRPLEKMLEDGSFRKDLFYRLNVLPIHLPPLRDRIDDIDALSQVMLKKFNKRHARTMTGFSSEAMQAIHSYEWPGNIRELENVIEHAFVLEASNVVQLQSLPEKMRALVPQAEGLAGKNPCEVIFSSVLSDSKQLDYPALKEQFEKEFLLQALRQYKGRINKTAEHTHMTKVTLLRKLEKYAIDPRAFH